MSQLLTPVKTTTSISRAENIHSDHIKSSRNVPLESVEDVVAAVNGEPDLGLLCNVLDWLRPSKKDPERRVAEYGPKNAEVKFSFLEKIIPNFWPSLYQSHDSEHKNVKILLLRFFSDVAGVASLASHCRLTLRTFKSSPSKDQYEATANSLNNTLSFTAQLLKPQSSVYRHWKKLQESSLNATQKALSWKEYASVLASGRVLSLAAEAQKSISERGLEYLGDAWITDGRSYSTWLGKNLAFMLHEIDLGDGEAWKALKLMLSKSLTLGYNSESPVLEAESVLESTQMNYFEPCSRLFCPETSVRRNDPNVWSQNFLPTSKNVFSIPCYIYFRKTLGNVSIPNSV